MGLWIIGFIIFTYCPLYDLLDFFFTIKTHYGYRKNKDVRIHKISCAEHIQDTGIPGAISLGNTKGEAIQVDQRDIYPIHSVAKILTGVLTMTMMHEKPDGTHPILPKDNVDKSIKDQITPNAWSKLPASVQSHLDSKHITLQQLMTHKGAHHELALERRNFFGLFKTFILDKAGMSDFFETTPLDSHYTVQTNPIDTVALSWVGRLQAGIGAQQVIF